jgi:hypothetical protein
MTAVTSVWDIRVVPYNDPTTVLSYIPRWSSLEFSDAINDVGSGKMVHDLNDAFFGDFEAEHGQSLLTGPYALQIVRDNVAVMTFFIEDVEVERTGFTQPITISGRGIASALEWAVVLPEGFSPETRAGASSITKPKFFDRLFAGYEWVTRVATTQSLDVSYADGLFADVPGVGATLTSNSNAEINILGIDGVTDLILGDTILVKDQDLPSRNGVYRISDVGSPTTPYVLTRWATCDGSPAKDLDIGNMCFVQQGTTNAYRAFELTDTNGFTEPTQMGSVALTFTPNTSATWTGLSAFWALFAEADTGYEFFSTKENWGTVNYAAGRGGANFAVDWPLSLDNVLADNQGLADSKGHIVPDGGTFTVPAGKTLLEALQQVTSQTSTSWHVNAYGEISIALTPFETSAYTQNIPFGIDRASGAGTMIFHLPMLKSANTKTSSSERRTVVYGTDGVQIDRLVSPSTSTFGHRESYFENTGDDAPSVNNITAAALRKIDGGKLQLTATYIESIGYVPWIDYGIGDKVLVENTPGNYVERIIAAISSTISNSNDQTLEVTFGEVLSDKALKLEQAAGFGAINARTIQTFSGRPANVFLTAPTGAAAVGTVEGLSNRAIFTWDQSSSAKVSQYDVAVYREDSYLSGSEWIPYTWDVVTARRTDNLVTLDLSASTSVVVGDIINVYAESNPHAGSEPYCNTDTSWSGWNLKVIAKESPNTLTYSNTGPNVDWATLCHSTNNYVAAVTKVIESHNTKVDGDTTTAAIENLAAPGHLYKYRVTPINEYGQAGKPSNPDSFVASTGAFRLLDSEIRSSNYVSGSVGWSIHSDGNAYFNSLTANAYLTGGSIDIGSGSTSFHVSSTGNMWLGASTYSTSAPFYVTSTGYLKASTGLIAGFNLNNEWMGLGGTFLGYMNLGNLKDSGIGNGVDGTQLAGVFMVGPSGGSYKGNVGLVTFDSAKYSNDAGQKALLTPKGLQFNSDTNYYRIRLSGTNICHDIENSSGTVTTYCYAATTGATTTTTTTGATTAAPYRSCNPGDIGYYGCNNPGECRQGASGASCDPNTTTTTTTTTTTAAPTTTTTTPAPYMFCNPGDIGFYGCYNVAECRQGASGSVCDPNTTTTAAPTTTTTTTAAPTTTTTTTTTTTAAPTTTTTTTTTTAAPNRYCNPGDIGFYGCTSVGQCRSGASGALCTTDLTTTTTTTTAAPSFTTAAPSFTTAAPSFTTATPNRTCQPGNVGFFGCTAPGQCRQGASGALC